MAPATLYKARSVRTKQPVCAICVDRTRGRTERLEFGYGVAVWLCERHRAVEFLTRRGGRDIVATLQQLWTAHGCLTAARRKALESHLHSLRACPRGDFPAPTPGQRCGFGRSMHSPPAGPPAPSYRTFSNQRTARQPPPAFGRSGGGVVSGAGSPDLPDVAEPSSDVAIATRRRTAGRLTGPCCA